MYLTEYGNTVFLIDDKWDIYYMTDKCIMLILWPYGVGTLVDSAMVINEAQYLKRTKTEAEIDQWRQEIIDEL